MLTTLYVDCDIAAMPNPFALVRLWAQVSDDLGPIEVFALLVLLGFVLTNDASPPCRTPGAAPEVPLLGKLNRLH